MNFIFIMNNKKMETITCPECGRKVPWQNNRFRPFCSSRCKQIDLGRWLNEEYALPVMEPHGFDSESEGSSKQGHIH